MPPGSRNAFVPAVRNAMFRHEDPLMNVVPSPGWEHGMPSPVQRDYSPLQYADEFLTGLSRGRGAATTGDLQLAYDLATRPRGVYQDLVDAAKTVVKNPSLLVNALKTSVARGMSGPQAAGEMVGGFLSPGNMLRKRGPETANIVVHHGTTEEAAKKIAEEGFNPALSGARQQFSAQVPGAWFTREPSITERFGPVRLSEDVVLKKPYRMAASTYLQKFLYNGEDPVAFRNELEKKGYDGIRIAPHPEYAGGLGPAGTEEWGYENFVVFDPAKSIRKKTK